MGMNPCGRASLKVLYHDAQLGLLYRLAFRMGISCDVCSAFIERANLYVVRTLPYGLQLLEFRWSARILHRLVCSEKERFPILNIGRVANERRNRHLFRSAGNRAQFQARLMR